MSGGIDWDDPCAVLALLRPAYYDLIQGKAVRQLTHNGKVIIRQTTDPAVLKAEIATLEAACAAKTGNTAKRRFAIRAG